jgi:phage gp36-like protein
MLGDLVEKWRVQAMRTLQGWTTERRTLRGLPVTLVNTRPDIDSELVFRRLDTALGLIQQYRPATFAQLLQDFARIQVVRYPCRAAFYPDTRTCVVELTFSVNPDFTEAQVASSIVHEGMHAHVYAMGQSDPTERPDEERLCRQAELEFGLAIPDGEAIVRRATESLQLEDDDVAPVIDWQQAQRAIAEVDASASARRHEGRAR